MAEAGVVSITEADSLTASLTAIIVAELLFATQSARALGSFIVLVSRRQQPGCNEKTVTFVQSIKLQSFYFMSFHMINILIDRV